VCQHDVITKLCLCLSRFQKSRTPKVTVNLLTCSIVPLEKPTLTQLVIFPSILQNLKVHYHVQNTSSLVPILSRMNPVHTFPCYFFKIHLDIILPFTPRSSKLFCHVCPPKLCIFRLSHAFHVPCPIFYHPSNIWEGVQIMKLLMIFSSLLFLSCETKFHTHTQEK
jgi:hypothetical protein